MMRKMAIRLKGSRIWSQREWTEKETCDSHLHQNDIDRYRIKFNVDSDILLRWSV